MMGRERTSPPTPASVNVTPDGRTGLRSSPRCSGGSRRLHQVDELRGSARVVRFPMGVVRTVAEVADSDWAAHAYAVAEVGDRSGGTIRIPDAPWRFSDAEVGVAGDPPSAASTTTRCWPSSALSGDEVRRLEQDGVLSSRVPSR
jgi:crotonobetainyl-CoA:carnitine CoA-transferase CaiB-like acyl-CoA transferase